MSYRNKTYVIFDGDDIRSYSLMKAWRENERIEFDFHDAHETRDIRSDSEEASVKRGLRERFSNSKQAIVLIGSQTRYLYRYVRWEIEVTQDLGLPIIASNLNGLREYDEKRCPPILREYYTVHVSFGPKIIKYALDNFPAEFYRNRSNPGEGKIRNYPGTVYAGL